MSLVYTLNPPIQVGDLTKAITVSSLKLVSVAINYEDAYTKNGKAVLSICLADPISGYPLNVVYEDASALDMARTIEGQVGAELFQKLIADGKLPAGTLS
jgi:hypothetical protein